ncbi:MAG TPA: hypothetical protein VHW66_19205 [Stellaceae bacterium]|nr:hypothetical protein [Stellaceae bacterium]
MKTLSLWQPWASFIAIGVKPFETRGWAPPPALIGQRIAIHAAKKPVDADNREWSRRAGVEGDLPLGAIICTAILAGAYLCGLVASRSAPAVWVTRRIGDSPHKAHLITDDYGDYSPGRFAWWLTDIERFVPPILARGAQGFWEWSGTLGMKAADCGTCRHRNNGTLADYCYHAALDQTHPCDGRPIPSYPKSPIWCPGYELEDGDPVEVAA